MRTGIKATDIQAVWERIPERILKILQIQCANNYILSAQQQFQNYYHDRYFKWPDRELCKEKFLMIFFSTSNTLLLDQIEKNNEFVKQLGDMTNWADETLTESSGSNDSTNNTTNTRQGKNRSGASDNNSSTDDTINNSWLDVNSETNILANSFNQTDTLDNERSENTNSGTNKQNSKTRSSNSSTDYIQYLNLQLPEDYRKLFFSKFNQLFYY